MSVTAALPLNTQANIITQNTNFMHEIKDNLIIKIKKQIKY